MGMSPLDWSYAHFLWAKKLFYSDIFRGRPLVALFDIEGNPVALAKALKTACIDCRMVNKDIGAVSLLDKAKPFFIVEPLNLAICHGGILLSFFVYSKFKLEDAIQREEVVL